MKTVDWKTMEEEPDLWRYDLIRCRLLGWEVGMRLHARWYLQSESNGETVALLRRDGYDQHLRYKEAGFPHTQSPIARPLL